MLGLATVQRGSRATQRPSRQTGTGSIDAGQSCCWQRTAEQVRVHTAWSASARFFDSTRRWQTQTQQSSAFLGSTAGRKVSVQSVSVWQPSLPAAGRDCGGGPLWPESALAGLSVVRAPRSCDEQASTAKRSAARRIVSSIAWPGCA